MTSFNKKHLTCDKQQRYHHGMGTSTGPKPVPFASHPDAGPTAADATGIYTSSTRTATAAAFTTFTAAFPTDIYTATCTGARAVPKQASTAAHTAAAAGHITAAAHTTAAALSTNCHRFRAAAPAIRQPTNRTTASITECKFLPAVVHVATSHRH